jgi:hypothetical protein
MAEDVNEQTGTVVEETPSDVQEAPIESSSHDRESSNDKSFRRERSLIDFFEGKDASGDGIPSHLWGKILDAKMNGTTPNEVEQAYRNIKEDDDRRLIRDSVQDAVNEALPPITPDYFPTDGINAGHLDPRLEGLDLSPQEIIEYKAELLLAQREEAKQYDAIAENYNARAVEAVRNHPDFDDVLQKAGDPIVPPLVQEALVRLPNGPEVMYQALKSGELKEWLSGSPVTAISELAKLSVKLGGGQSETSRTPKPRPPQTIRYAASSDDGELNDELSPEEWARRFDLKMQKHNKR